MGKKRSEYTETFWCLYFQGFIEGLLPCLQIDSVTTRSLLTEPDIVATS